MVRKRSSADRIEKMTRKKIRVQEESLFEICTTPAKPNHLSDRLFSLQRQSNSTVNKSSVLQQEECSRSDQTKKTIHLGDHLCSVQRQGNSTVSKSPALRQEEESFRSDQTKNSSKIQDLEDLKTPNKTGKLTTKKKNFAVQPKQSKLLVKDVGGLNDILAKILLAFLHMKYPELPCMLGFRPNSSIFLHGPPGSGKTHVVQAIAGELQFLLQSYCKLSYIEIVATELVSSVSGEAESRIRDMFEEALKCSPCILFIDKLDAICPKRDTAEKSMERRIVSQLCTCIHDLTVKDSESKVIVIAATDKPDFIDQTLRGHFELEIALGMPNEETRLKILEVLCKDVKLSPDFDMKWLARNTPGYVGADLKTLRNTALELGNQRIWKKLYAGVNDAQAENESGTEPTLDTVLSWFKSEAKIPLSEIENIYFEQQEFQAALKTCIPYAKREGFGTVPDITWDDVGALEHIKKQLQETVLWPIMYRKAYEQAGMSSTKGILLFGPKGCGKTLLAKALANECSINFLSVKGPELLNMYLGESERQVRQCFERAQYSAPCIIFFDEFDSLCPPRTGAQSNQAVEKVVNQLLTLMDGTEERKEVIVIGATNRIDKIDSAMLRPGRLEKVIYVDVPSPAERVEILKTITKNKTKPRVSEDVQLEDIALDPRCENFSGADLAYLVREAFQSAIKESLQSPAFSSELNVVLQKQHFEQAFGVVKPSITEKDKQYFKRCREELSISKG